MQGILVSVVTITLNDIAGLRLTMNSLSAQKYPNLEIIVIDGGSSDGTGRYLESLPVKQLKFISERDDGVSDAFNKGLGLAQGDLLIFLNAGDVFADERTVSRAMESIPSNTSVRESILYGDYYQVIDGETTRFTCDHLQLTSTCSLNHQSSFVGFTVYKRFQFDTRLKVEMDYDYWLRCLRANVAFVKIEMPIAKFQMGGLSSGLRLRVHIYIVRYFLLAMQRRETIKTGDIFVLFCGAVYVQTTSWLRSLLGRAVIHNAKQFLRTLGLKRKPDF